ncbi:MAG: double-strand break repair protein AddB, partial [Alphaproteobacteria bacterium]
RIDCPGAEEEASVIALLMREVLETPGKTAALVTPDRTLARRVSAALKRWKLEIDDSAGRPLAATPAGTFLRLGALALAEALSPVSLLAVLKHPLACGGKSGGAFKYAVRRFERDLLRGPRPAPGIDGLEATLTAANFDPQIEKAHRKFIQDLAKWAAPFLNISVQDKTPLRDLIRAHLYFLEGLAADDQNPGASRLWSGNDGDAIQSFIAELLEIAPNLPPLPVARYPALLNAFLTGRVIRPLWGSHPRLFVWGPLEARLQHADRIILGGLNEGTWPAEPMADPWLSRPMRLRMGLPPATRRIGQAAHDFATASHNPEIFFTRATRVDGTPTVPSRWLLRLESVLTAAQLKEQMQTPLLQDPRWLAWQVKIDTAKQTRHLTPPAPCPPIAARPRRLSVTEIETWRRDPYAIYARRILRLEKLDELDAKLMANTYGTLVHDILDRFLHLYPDTLPADADAQLMKMGENIFGSATARPHVWGFWRPRFQRIARWFIAEERNRRMDVKKIHSEIKGELILGSGDHTFTLSAKVDRIDELVAGGLTIIDYKTGSYPKPPEVEAGFSPQLPLEAMMAMHGAFAAHGIPATTQIAALEYWHLPGNNAIPGSVKSASKNKSPDLLAREALDGLTGLIAVFDDPTTPYLARPYPKYAPDFSNYTHLSRMAEWSLEEDKGDDL